MEILSPSPFGHHLHHPLYQSLPWLLSSPRFLSYSRHIWNRMPLGDVLSCNLCLQGYKSFRESPIMSVNKGNLTTNINELCEVVWTVGAHLDAGELLYVTGDHAVLGFWDPDKAVLISPTEHENIWRAEVKIATGFCIKYNYFIKGNSWSTSNIIWRPRPMFSLSVPSIALQDMKIAVKDSWNRFNSNIPSIHAWDSWVEEAYLLLTPFMSIRDKDASEVVDIYETELIKVKPLRRQDIISSSDEEIVTASKEYFNATEVISERGQHIEEPWLLYSSFSPVLVDKVNSDVHKVDDLLKDELNLEDSENMLPKEGGNLVSKDPVSTTILINSSICTIQRIAVLEDGELVELLMEPVKSNVQCDSVYIGVIMKLVPHMGGAFVNIGNSRPSLMDIKKNREPFIFPPFLPGKVKNESDDYDGSDNGSLLSVHDDCDGHETDSDFDVLKENVNSHTVDDVKADFEEDFGGSEVNLEGETDDSSTLAAGVNGSISHEILQVQERQVPTYTCTDENKWIQVQKGTKIIVQVVKEGLGTKGPTLTAYPKLKSRFWILIACCNKIGISKKIFGVERTRLKVIAKTLQPQGFGLTVRTVAAGHSLEELQKDLDGLLSTWKNIIEHAKSAALAADEGVEGAVPVILHRAMGQTLSIVQDYFNEKVKMVVDSPRTYHEVTNYLQETAPDLCYRVELYDKKVPLFDEFNIEDEIDNILSKRVPLANGGSLVIEQTEALVSIDVNGGHGMFGHGNSQEKAILDVNLAAAKQIARELRLRDIGGIIVVDFIDMSDESNKRLVYEEVKKAVERDRSTVKVSELSRHGLMEITRKRVRPSVTFMISEPCTCCHATGRVEALETSFSKVEQEICRLLARMDQRADPENPKSWPKFILRIDHHMCNYLTSGKKTRLALLSSSLKVWILLKVARGFTRGAFEVKPFSDDKVDRNRHQAAIPMLPITDARAHISSQNVTLFPVKRSNKIS